MNKKLLTALTGGGFFAWWFTRKKIADDVSMTVTGYLAARLPDYAQQYVADVAAGLSGTMPDDFVDPNGGDPNLRWALDVAAVADYESGYGTAAGYFPKGDPTGWGDGGNAFGFWQLDKHYHSAFINSTDAQDPSVTVKAQAKYAAKQLAANWHSFSTQVPSAREQLMFITYNASLSRIRSMLNQGSTLAQMDATTTQRNGSGYGTNVTSLINGWA